MSKWRSCNHAVQEWFLRRKFDGSSVLAPGPLRKACGFYYQEFTNFKELALKDNPFKVDEASNKVYDWGEYLIPETAKALAYYDHHYLENIRPLPLITSERNLTL